VREGQTAGGQPILPRADRIRFDEAAADLRAHYQATGSRDLKEANFRLAHLDRFFGGWRRVAIDRGAVRQYVLRRQAAGAANSTINREVGVRTLGLAYEGRKLLRLPVIRKIKEAPPRQGFFEPAAFEAVRRELRPDLRVAVALAYALGWRMQSEVLPLALRQMDLQTGTIRLDPGQAKNEEGRVVYLPADLKVLVAAQVKQVRALERKLGRIIPHLFPHLQGRHRGERIKDFRRAWQGACRRAAPLEYADGVPSGSDGKPGRHRVTTTLPTRTGEGSGMVSPWACMSSRQGSMASRMLSSAPSTMSPWL
jgi:integrase